MTPAEGRNTIQRWLGLARYEVIPLEGAEERVLQSVGTDIKITVTASPRRGLDPTLELAERLAGQGYVAVPHVSARLVADGSHLDQVVERLRVANIREVFVVAGDSAQPAGQFEGSFELLQAMHERGHSFDDLGIAGYPESHPLIDDDVTIQSMWDKRRYATYIVSGGGSSCPSTSDYRASPIPRSCSACHRRSESGTRLGFSPRAGAAYCAW
jgi:methylenetetrahydrofolate reductase (NADPH)